MQLNTNANSTFYFFPSDNAYVLPQYFHCGQTLSCYLWIGWPFFRNAKSGRILQTANTKLRL